MASNTSPAQKVFDEALAYQKGLTTDSVNTLKKTKNLQSAANAALKAQIARQNQALSAQALAELQRLGLGGNVNQYSDLTGQNAFFQMINDLAAKNELSQQDQMINNETTRGKELDTLNRTVLDEAKDRSEQEGEGFVPFGGGGFGGGFGGGGFAPFIPYGDGGGYGTYSDVLPERSAEVQEGIDSLMSLADKVYGTSWLGVGKYKPKTEQEKFENLLIKNPGIADSFEHFTSSGLRDTGVSDEDDGLLSLIKKLPRASSVSTRRKGKGIDETRRERVLENDDDDGTSGILNATRTARKLIRRSPGNTVSATAADREYEKRDKRRKRKRNNDNDDDDDEQKGHTKSGGSYTRRNAGKGHTDDGGKTRRRRKTKGRGHKSVKKKRKKKKKKFRGKRPGPG